MTDEVRALIADLRIMEQEVGVDAWPTLARKAADALEAGLADAARVARVRVELDAQTATSALPFYRPGALVYGDLADDIRKALDECYVYSARTVIDAIRAALDGTSTTNQLADAAAANDAWRAKPSGYRDDQPGVPDPTPQELGASVGHDCSAPGEPCDGCDHEGVDGDEPPCNGCAHGGVPAHRGGYPCLHTKRLPQLFEMAPINITGGMDPADFLDPDGASLDTLEDLVRQSAERGECVVIDGRGSGTTVKWWPETASDEAPMRVTCGGTDLREALDRAKEGERGE